MSRVELDDLVPLCAMHRTAGNHHPIDERVDFFFELRSWRGEPRLVEEDKAAELRWFRLGALPAPVVSHELLRARPAPRRRPRSGRHVRLLSRHVRSEASFPQPRSPP